MAAQLRAVPRLSVITSHIQARSFSSVSKRKFDFLIIGGGSGGLAASKEAAKHGKSVAVLDFVKPSPQGSTWGLGGTCVNVGCIPKKLMHRAAELAEGARDQYFFGCHEAQDGDQYPTPQHHWGRLVQAVQDHIMSLNFGYRTQLRSEKVEYINALAKFVSSNEVEATDRKGKKQLLEADNILVAVGGRPKYPDFPGAQEHCITSDDIFSLPTPPGKTLVVGASYVALECAGFLTALGHPATVMARSIFLRGFDQQMAGVIVEYMKNHGTRFLDPYVPTRVDKKDNGKLVVTYRQTNGSGQETQEEFDTVLLAIGREPDTSNLQLDQAGVKCDSSGKIITNPSEQTSAPNIFAIGDVAVGRPELTPTAIMAGKLLARRLFAGSAQLMDYSSVPTTVFTPLEYGCVGLSEEAALAQCGSDKVEVYHSYFQPLEWSVPHREDNACFAKVIVDRSNDEHVLGMHYCGPHAGEVIQGFASALKKGLTKADLDTTVGVHPTNAEVFTMLSISKSSGVDSKRTGC